MNKEKFKRLKKEWKEDTEFMSSPTERANHPAYQQVIDAGEDAIPLIIEDLRESPDHWFVALHEITEEEVIPQEHAGWVDKMAQDWIEWYENRS